MSRASYRWAPAAPPEGWGSAHFGCPSRKINEDIKFTHYCYMGSHKMKGTACVLVLSVVSHFLSDISHITLGINHARVNITQEMMCHGSPTYGFPNCWAVSFKEAYSSLLSYSFPQNKSLNHIGCCEILGTSLSSYDSTLRASPLVCYHNCWGMYIPSVTQQPMC